ncbi:MAG TPA: site-specific DNA-methyltransferase [Thermodesulfovibrio thiophilus]|nr:site-specific DNA-methyltransferase [Thermodesulfovibrio thiophilus]
MSYLYLPIDTKFFKDLENELLACFSEDELDGYLIKSENYQALNTILPKFKEKVQTIYIDPPFNKKQKSDYLYNSKYRDSIWACFLENKLQLATDLLKDTGGMFVKCDYNGNWLVRYLMDTVFGKNNFRNEIILKRTKTLKGENKRFNTSHDSLFFYAKNVDYLLFNGYKKLKDKSEWVRMHLPGAVKGDASRVVFGKKILPPTGRKWVLNQAGFDDAIKKGLIKWDDEIQEPLFLSKYETIGSDWTDAPGYAFSWNFKTENSEIILKRVIESTSNEGDLVMDFFLGSGTTTAVAHKLGRKWIGVEMGEHFYSVVLPRMKKVLAYDKSGISKEKDVKEMYNEKTAGGFFKYYELEQFENVI